MRSRRLAAAALAAALTITSFELAPAYAAPSKAPQASQTDTLDLSARRRHRHYGNRAAIGAFLGVAGTIAAIAAANSYRDDYYYYGSPYAYGPGPYYYGGGPYYYGGGYYRGGGRAFHGGGHRGGGHHRHH